MTKFEKAVELIANSFKEDCIEYECTIREIFKMMQMDSEDLKEEFLFALNDENFDGFFTEDCEIEDDDGKFKTFKQLVNAVKKYQF